MDTNLIDRPKWSFGSAVTYMGVLTVVCSVRVRPAGNVGG